MTVSSEAAASGLHVVGRHLYDRCGEKVVLRGVNKMVIWTDRDGVPSFSEIARTGANCVRIVWLTSGTAAELEAVVTNAEAARLIPLVDLHDGTGDWSWLPRLVDYWTREDIVAVTARHHDWMLVNVGNEVGDGFVTPAQFRSGYTAAVRRMRETGIHVPLVIDGTDWGKDIDVLQSEGPSLMAADPDHNLVFSVHMWWPRMWGYTETTVTRELEESVTAGLPLLVGEFGNQWTERASGEIPYRTILEETQRLEVGMLVWEWGPGNQPQDWLDMTADGTYDTLFGWGLEVAVLHPSGLASTARRPYAMVHGRCAPRAPRASLREGP